MAMDTMLYGTGDAAEALGVSRPRLDRMIERGEIVVYPHRAPTTHRIITGDEVRRVKILQAARLQAEAAEAARAAIEIA